VQKVRVHREIKKKSIRELKKALWLWFSRFVRLRDKFICYTCGRKGNDAGHYVAQGKSSFLKYDERNVHCQCMTCNRFLSGNLVKYALKLEEQYGAGILQELYAIKGNTYKPTHAELEGLIEHYKEAVEEMGGWKRRSNELENR
jgi:hypothetical protein